MPYKNICVAMTLAIELTYFQGCQVYRFFPLFNSCLLLKKAGSAVSTEE